ncbi:MAG: SDR family oxidoreductase [Planctomycetota bacterium]
MKVEHFVKRSAIETSADRLYRWHARPGAIHRLVPPWEKMQVIDPGPGVIDGARAVIRVKAGPFWRQWVAEHRQCEEGRQFQDVQIRGPFRSWEHLHRFEDDGPDRSRLEDRVKYALPFGFVGRLLGGRYTRRKLERMFAYRHRVTREDLAAHGLYRGATAMRVLVSGSSGLIGRALVPYLQTGGHAVVPLVRRAPAEGEATWNPRLGTIDLSTAAGVDAVVHLAAEGIANGRWSERRKRRILESRTEGTRLLAEALARLPRPPQVLVSASGVGIYGDRGDEILTEETEAGDGFLADVARAWEEATAPAGQAGIRVVHARFGAVLSPAGGALAKMLPPFRAGVGGRLGRRCAAR